MALKRKKLLKAVGVACAVFAAVAAIVGAVFGIVGAVEYFGLPNYVIGIVIFVPAFVFLVITAYKEQ